MNKTIAILISASVLLMTAITVIMMFTDSFGSSMENAENIKDSKCEFQIENSEERSELTSECRKKVDEAQYITQKTENSNCLIERC